MGSERIAVVTVHGTGDTAPDPDGEPNGDRWFQTKSKFVSGLKQRLARHGLDADIIPFLWSGANSASARDQSSAKLAEKLQRLGRVYGGRVHVVCHSHGGNVANDAALRLNWSHNQKRRKVASITTVATPFFRSRVTGGDRFGAWAFLFVIAASLLLIPVITAFFGDAVTAALSDIFSMPGKDTQFDEARRTFEQSTEESRADARPLLAWLSTNAVMVVSAIALLFMVPLAFRGLRRISRAAQRARSETKLHSIWHNNDEAISFLTRIEKVPLEPFPRWSLFRGSRTGGIVWGVQAIIALNIIGLLVLAYDVFVRRIDLSANLYDAYGVYLLILGIAGAPIVFALTYLLYRLFAMIILELSLRGMLNGAIGGALVAIAVGRDGDHRIGEAAPRSHYYGCEEVILSGEVASRMVADSAEASQRLFDKYRGAVFSVEEEGNAIQQLSQDALTWDSLIHCSYFDQPEVVDTIGDYIARKAKEEVADA